MSVSFFLRFLRSGLGTCCIENKEKQKEKQDRHVLYVSMINKH